MFYLIVFLFLEISRLFCARFSPIFNAKQSNDPQSKIPKMKCQKFISVSIKKGKTVYARKKCIQTKRVGAQALDFHCLIHMRWCSLRWVSLSLKCWSFVFVIFLNEYAGANTLKCGIYNWILTNYDYTIMVIKTREDRAAYCFK